MEVTNFIMASAIEIVIETIAAVIGHPSSPSIDTIKEI